MTLRITTSFQGQESVREYRQDALSIGRPNEQEAPDIDLSPDIYVSRQHAVLRVGDGGCWIKDLGSKFGTKVNGQEIKDQGEHQITPGDALLFGETTLRFEIVVEAVVPPAPTPTAEEEPEPEVRVLETIEFGTTLVDLTRSPSAEMEQRLGLFCELPMQFAAVTRLELLLPLVVKRAVQLTPGAQHGALLLRGKGVETLLLKAYVSEDAPVVSETLVRRALAENCGFIWRQDAGGDVSRSVRELRIATGMYAPLLWQGQALGVLCVDTPEPAAVFTSEHLRLLMAVAQYAAMALANHRLEAELRQNTRLLERLLTSFSPTIREVLLERARHGRLRPGGDKSEVSILFCDICGFTSLAAGMDSSDVVDLLNDYFSALAQAIFRYDGTIDKFVGDAVLAVFGSPEADPAHQEKAVRAAMAMQAAMQAVNRERAARGETTCHIRVGVHCGEVFHGFIGAAERLEFTVIGDAVNRASRYCHHAGENQVLISTDIFQHVFSIVQAEKTAITAKEGELVAYRVKNLRD